MTPPDLAAIEARAASKGRTPERDMALLHQIVLVDVPALIEYARALERKVERAEARHDEAGFALVPVVKERAELRERVTALETRLRETCQTLVAAVGADGPCDAEDAARRTVERVTALETALADARSLLLECLSDYGHPNFTDRHGTANRISALLSAPGRKEKA